MPSSHVVVSRASAALHRSALARHVPLGLILVLASVLRLLYLDAPLLDAHRWRQVDTAFMARAFSETGINVLKPEANWGGAHGYVESEFPLLPAIVAVLYSAFGPNEMWVTGEPGGQPVRAACRFLTSPPASSARSASPRDHQREKTGLGQRVDGSLLETAVSCSPSTRRAIS